MTGGVVDPIAVTLLVAAAVERAGGAYFVGGSLASSLQGEPRATNDVDMVIELPRGEVGTFVQTLGADFEVDVDSLRSAVLRGGSCNIFYLPTVMKIDLFAVGASPFDEIEFSRRRAVRVGEGDQTLVLKSPEDTVLRKLLWYESGGRVSERQWRDVVQVLRVSGSTMDRDYMQKWAAALDIVELLRRASEDAE